MSRRLLDDCALIPNKGRMLTLTSSSVSELCVINGGQEVSEEMTAGLR